MDLCLNIIGLPSLILTRIANINKKGDSTIKPHSEPTISINLLKNFQ